MILTLKILYRTYVVARRCSCSWAAKQSPPKTGIASGKTRGALATTCFCFFLEIYSICTVEKLKIKPAGFLLANKKMKWLTQGE
jgi:hypothetical protein